MNPSNPFELETAIRDWRLQLAAQPSVTGDASAELEEHLRTSIVDLQGRGLSQREAFQISIQRLGTPGDLEPEFGRVHPWGVWRWRLLWMALGWLALGYWRSLGLWNKWMLWVGPTTGRPSDLGNLRVVVYAILMNDVLPVLLAVWVARRIVKVRFAGLDWILADRRRIFAVVVGLGGLLQILGQGTSEWMSNFMTDDTHHAQFHSMTTLPGSFIAGMLSSMALGIALAWLMPTTGRKSGVSTGR